MSLASNIRQWVYLVHRWTGIGSCVLMLLWFVSGIVMLWIGYPKLTPWERLAALSELSSECCITSPIFSSDGIGSGEIVLTSVSGHPRYVVSTGGRFQVTHGQTARPLTTPFGEEEAIAASAAFIATTINAASPIEESSGTDAYASTRYEGLIHEDRWTHSRGLDLHRPLHKVTVFATEPLTLYVSSQTGQVVMDAPLSQQRWNYVGAWLHWLYMFRRTSVDPGWTWTVILLSFTATISAVSGLCVGLWRWRFGRRYKSGSRSPYREHWMKWHHIAGLLFGGFIFTWIFSGLMSMNPGGVFSATARPDHVAYQGRISPDIGPLADPSAIIATLNHTRFRPVELHWLSVGGRPYVLAYDRTAATRLVTLKQGELSVQQAWDEADILPAARRLFDAPTADEQVIRRYEAHYYQRHAEAMNGARIHGLPALRLDFLDADRTRIYIDLNTGLVVSSLSYRQRVGRWLFYFLHSWDLPALLEPKPLRNAILLALSIGGIVVSGAGVVIGWRRLRRTARVGRA